MKMDGKHSFSGRKIDPPLVLPNMTVSQLIDYFALTGYNARRLSEAAEIMKFMIDTAAASFQTEPPLNPLKPQHNYENAFSFPHRVILRSKRPFPNCQPCGTGGLHRHPAASRARRRRERNRGDRFDRTNFSTKCCSPFCQGRSEWA